MHKLNVFELYPRISNRIVIYSKSLCENRNASHSHYYCFTRQV